MDSYDSLSDLPGDIVLQIRREDADEPGVFYFNVDIREDLDKEDLMLIYEVFKDVMEMEIAGDVEVFEA